MWGPSKTRKASEEMEAKKKKQSICVYVATPSDTAARLETADLLNNGLAYENTSGTFKNLGKRVSGRETSLQGAVTPWCSPLGVLYPNCTGPRIPDLPDALRAACEVLTEALCRNPARYHFPVLDSIDKMQARAHTSPKRAQDPHPDLPNAPRAAREVLTEALRVLKYAPGVAVLRSIIRPLLDIIDKMQGLGCLRNAGLSRDKSGDTSGEDRLEASDGGTGGTGGAGNLGGQGGTGHGQVTTVARPGGGFCFN
ncbi:hypothetical protein K438DRAFT_1763079 [Mycena galopus ATCC 62051]|nr:hypothetical protein K438DRAFT_1763079 [Mycena galopus ATCC 62051]